MTLKQFVNSVPFKVIDAEGDYKNCLHQFDIMITTNRKNDLDWATINFNIYFVLSSS